MSLSPNDEWLREQLADVEHLRNDPVEASARIIKSIELSIAAVPPQQQMAVLKMVSDELQTWIAAITSG